MVGVLLGCEVAKSVELYNDDETGLIESWNATLKSRSREVEWVEDSRLVGVWVVVPWHGQDKGVSDDVGPTRLDRLNTSKAKVAWEKFVAFAKKRGVHLGEAALWLARTEVA